MFYSAEVFIYQAERLSHTYTPNVEIPCRLSSQPQQLAGGHYWSCCFCFKADVSSLSLTLDREDAVSMHVCGQPCHQHKRPEDNEK